eukprot:9502092-Pyramimonas_sp.AAC.1
MGDWRPRKHPSRRLGRPKCLLRLLDRRATGAGSKVRGPVSHGCGGPPRTSTIHFAPLAAAIISSCWLRGLRAASGLMKRPCHSRGPSPEAPEPSRAAL